MLGSAYKHSRSHLGGRSIVSAVRPDEGEAVLSKSGYSVLEEASTYGYKQMTPAGGSRADRMWAR